MSETEHLEREADRWYHEARYLAGRLEQATRAYEIMKAERDGYRNLLNREAELRLDALAMEVRPIFLRNVAGTPCLD